MTEEVDTSQFNADELQAPEWLNAQFIEEVLSAYEKVPLQVTDLKISPASAQGDHYASVMFRTVANYTTDKGKFSKPLIVKTMPEDEGHKKEMLSETHIFETEILMYTKALPEFERILQEAGDNTKLYVPCLYHSLEPRKVMIFEDLVPQGYTVIRNSDPSVADLNLAFAKLAKWHAVSMKVINEQPNFLKEFKHGVFDMPAINTDPFLTSGMGNFINMLDKIPELRKYKPHFEKIKDVYMKRMQLEAQEYHKNRRNDRYYVLSHGDFHLRNMMFRHNKNLGTYDDVMLVDFQFSYLCSITFDLTYSIYLLMEQEQRWEMGKDLINDYFTVLIDTLRKIGYKGDMPTQNGLWEQIHRNKYLDFYMITTSFPIMLGVKSNTINIHDVIHDAEARQKSFFNDAYVKDVSKLLEKFDELGYFKDL